MSCVRATARLQLHPGFTLFDAARQLDYYAALGISHLYLSPIWRAVPGSTHGYDVVDPTVVNPALGGDAAMRALSAMAREHGMGLVLDIVPNHMAAHADNRWWWDVLRHGRASAHAHWFDIDWGAPQAQGKLLLPILDRPLDAAIDEGVLWVDMDGDEPVLRHHGTRLPLSPGGIVATGTDALRALVQAQAYRPIWWRLGDDCLNYRRFFTVSALAGLQIQHEDVFATVHQLPLALLADGVIDGLRVDHVDGIADPRQYLHRLRGAMERACAGRDQRPLLWVEKILGPDEALPSAWDCDGSTGYDFMDQVSAWLHHAPGEVPLLKHWRQSSGRQAGFGAEARLARYEVLEHGLRSEFDALLRLLVRVERDTAAPTARFGRALLARALTALLVRFPVYRSHAAEMELDDHDRRLWTGVLDAVGLDEPADTAMAARWIAAHFLEKAAVQQSARASVRRRFQLLSAPLAAKAVEDRAFYRYGVLLSRNEVGSHPDQFALSTRAFHGRTLMRARRHPQAMLATATHDHKRGEDSRARLAVLSEHPQWWARQTRALDHRAARLGLALPPPGVRQMLWQTLLGAWPMRGIDDPAAFAARIMQWQRKALREADLFTSWADPDRAFEGRLEAFIDTLLLHPAGGSLRTCLHQAFVHIGAAGARNALAQTALRLTLPGVPDLYQGTEGWDLSLVDPDNRRSVDYPQRRTWLDDARTWPQLLAQWHDGTVKARLVQRLLALRRAQPALFADGDYQPLYADREVPMLAFMRGHEHARLLVAVARHSGRQPAWHGAALGSAHARGASLTVLPGKYRNILTGACFVSDGTPMRLRRLFDGSPVAIHASC